MGPRLVVLIGAPASGKSTWRKGFPGTVISTDDIRRDVFGVQFKPEVESKVWNIAHKRLAKALAEGRDVCFDATSTTVLARRPLIRIGKQNGARVEAVVFITELNTLLRRNAARPPGKRVEDEIVINKHEQLEMPSSAEGFDDILLIQSGFNPENGPNDVLLDHTEWEH